MTPQEIASALNGMEYRSNIPRDVIAIAEEFGIVIVFGASDDLCELRGAVYGELGCSPFLIDSKGFLPSFNDLCDEHNEIELENYFARKPNAQTVTPNWDDDGYSWTYTTGIPHETFDIVEDGEKYCRGIVFALKDVK